MSERPTIPENAAELIANAEVESSIEQSKWLKAAVFFGSMGLVGAALTAASDNENTALAGTAIAYTGIIGMSVVVNTYGYLFSKNREHPTH